MKFAFTGTNNVSFVAVLPGDYSNDGSVDAADYVVWRKHECARYLSHCGYSAR